MEKMIDNQIELNRPENALAMKWAVLDFHQTGEIDRAVEKLLRLNKEDKI